MRLAMLKNPSPRMKPCAADQSVNVPREFEKREKSRQDLQMRQ